MSHSLGLQVQLPFSLRKPVQLAPEIPGMPLHANEAYQYLKPSANDLCPCFLPQQCRSTLVSTSCSCASHYLSGIALF